MIGMNQTHEETCWNARSEVTEAEPDQKGKGPGLDEFDAVDAMERS